MFWKNVLTNLAASKKMFKCITLFEKHYKHQLFFFSQSMTNIFQISVSVSGVLTLLLSEKCFWSERFVNTKQNDFQRISDLYLKILRHIRHMLKLRLNCDCLFIFAHLEFEAGTGARRRWKSCVMQQNNIHLTL